MQSHVPEVNWRKLRKALGLTQQELSALLSISVREIGYLEAGTFRPHKSTLVLLKSFLQHPELKRRLELAKFADPFTNWPITEINLKGIE